MYRPVAVVVDLAVAQHPGLARYDLLRVDVEPVEAGRHVHREGVALVQRRDEGCTGPQASEHEALAGHVHVAGSAWIVDHHKAAILAPAKGAVAVNVFHLHLGTATARVGACKIGGIVERDCIVHSIAVDTAYCDLAPHGAGERAAKLHAAYRGLLPAVEGVLVLTVVALSPVYGALGNARRDGGAHPRLATLGGAAGMPEVAVHAYVVAGARSVFALGHLRHGLAAGKLVLGAHGLDRHIGVGEVDVGIEHAQLLGAAGEHERGLGGARTHIGVKQRVDAIDGAQDIDRACGTCCKHKTTSCDTGAYESFQFHVGVEFHCF